MRLFSDDKWQVEVKAGDVVRKNQRLFMKRVATYKTVHIN